MDSDFSERCVSERCVKGSTGEGLCRPRSEQAFATGQQRCSSRYRHSRQSPHGRRSPISSLSAVEVGGRCIGDDRKAAVGVQIPADSDYRINEVIIRLHDTAGGGAPFSLDVYDDNAGSPGSPVASIGSGTGNGQGTYDLYTLTPASLITLQAGAVYWITVSSSSDIYCAFGWSESGADPAGSIFPHIGIQRYSNGAWTDRSGDYMPQLEIDADPVVAPPVAAPASIPTLSPWALLLLALGMLSVAGISRRRG